MEIYTNELKPDETEIYLISRALEQCIKKYYRDPNNVKKFEEWKKRKKEVKDNELKED